LYVDRREAIDFAARLQTEDKKALAFMETALKDRYKGLRLYTIQKLNIRDDSVKKSVEPLLADIAKSDPSAMVRSNAIVALGKYKKDKYKELFLSSLNDSSYSVSGNALNALAAIDTTSALEKARVLSLQPAKGILGDAINNLLFTYADETDFDQLAARFENLSQGNSRFRVLIPFGNYLKRVKDKTNFTKGVDLIVQFRDALPQQMRQQFGNYLNEMVFKPITAAKQSAGMTEQADYVKSKITGN
jgi:aminopeptidase N